MISHDKSRWPSCWGVMPFVHSGYVGIEIGVAAGESALNFLASGCWMYLVDPFVRYAEEYQTYNEWGAENDPEIGFNLLKINLVGYEGRYKLLRMKSEDAVVLMPPVDFVYIDGNHYYEYVKRDIEMYWPKVKPGGYLMGHDYSSRGNLPENVVRAVDEFVSREHLVLEDVPRKSECWVVKKP